MKSHQSHTVFIFEGNNLGAHHRLSSISDTRVGRWSDKIEIDEALLHYARVEEDGLRTRP